MTKKPPLVSICCVTYNHAQFICQCLDGFLMQETNFEYEIIVHDDASTDGTKEILLEYMNKYPAKFKLVLQEENQWSQGVRGIFSRFTFPLAKGKYIALCEGDDYWTDPSKLQKQVDLLKANPNFAGCFHNTEIINVQGEVEGFILKQITTLPLPQKDVVAEPTRFGHTSSLVFRNNKDFFIPTHFQKSICDRILLYLVAEKGSWMGIDAVMSRYRLHPTGVYSPTNKANQLFFMLNVYESLKEDKEAFHKYKTEIKRKLVYYHHELMKAYRMHGKFRLYITHLLGFIKNEKKNIRLLKILIKEELLNRKN